MLRVAHRSHQRLSKMRNQSLSPHVVFAAIAGIALSTLGCSGQVFSSRSGDDAGDAAPNEDAAPTEDALPAPDGSPTPDGSPSDASTGPCPSSIPALGTGCAVEALQCEYGACEYPGCDNIMQCSSGTWQSSQEGTSFCPTPNGADCPPSMAAANGSSCELGAGRSSSCFYPTGGCYCGSLLGPTPIEVDGGTVPQTWHCDDPGPKCPFPRPRLGLACSDEGLGCQYLECDFDETCMGGLWIGLPEGCAVAGGAPGH
jgi:hypothetical protein